MQRSTRDACDGLCLLGLTLIFKMNQTHASCNRLEMDCTPKLSLEAGGKNEGKPGSLDQEAAAARVMLTSRESRVMEEGSPTGR